MIPTIHKNTNYQFSEPWFTDSWFTETMKYNLKIEVYDKNTQTQKKRANYILPPFLSVPLMLF